MIPIEDRAADLAFSAGMVGTEFGVEASGDLSPVGGWMPQVCGFVEDLAARFFV